MEKLVLSIVVLFLFISLGETENKIVKWLLIIAGIIFLMLIKSYL